jgi:hypothetical protein
MIEFSAARTPGFNSRKGTFGVERHPAGRRTPVCPVCRAIMGGRKRRTLSFQDERRALLIRQ